jgi:hypothetical protein
MPLHGRNFSGMFVLVCGRAVARLNSGVRRHNKRTSIVYVKKLALAAVVAIAALPAHAELKTCKDIVDSPESAEKTAELATIQAGGLRMAALIEAQNLYKGLQDQTVNPLGAVLEYYESTLIPTRNEANEALNLMVKQNGGNLSAAYKSFCPSENTELFDLYRKFFAFFYKQRTADKGG